MILFLFLFFSLLSSSSSPSFRIHVDRFASALEILVDDSVFISMPSINSDEWTLIGGNWVRDEAGSLERVLLVRRVAFGTHHDLLRYK